MTARKPYKGGSLIDGQTNLLVRADALSKHNMALMARGAIDRARIVKHARRGLLLYIGEAVHAETGRTGEAWALTAHGRRAVAK